MYQTGRRIKIYRELKGCAPSEFAARLGVSEAVVSQWENGCACPNADTLAEICLLLEISADEILGIETMDSKLTVKEERIIDKYRNMPDMQKAVCVLLGVEEL